PWVIQLVREHEMGGQELAVLARDARERLDALQQGLPRRANHALVVRRKRIDVTQVAGPTPFVEPAAQPLVHVRVPPRTQPARRVERLGVLIGPVRLPPPSPGEQTL